MWAGVKDLLGPTVPSYGSVLFLNFVWLYLFYLSPKIYVKNLSISTLENPKSVTDSGHLLLLLNIILSVILLIKYTPILD